MSKINKPGSNALVPYNVRQPLVLQTNRSQVRQLVSTGIAQQRRGNNNRRNRNNARNTARQIATVRSIPRNPRMHPFVRQLLSGPNYSGVLVEVPDGSQAPSIIMSFRQLITITPDTGAITFAIIPSLMGSFALYQGTVRVSIPKYANAGSPLWTGVPVPSVINGNKVAYLTVPFTEWLGITDSASKAFGPYSANSFRVLSTVASLDFTGSTFADNGVVGVTRYLLNPENSTATSTINGVVSNGNYIVQSPPTTLTALSSTVGFSSYPARESLALTNVNAVMEFQSTWFQRYMADAAGIGHFNTMVQNPTTTGLLSGFNPGVDNNCPSTFVSYSGMDATGSITVELRSTIEVTLTPISSVAPLATPNPPRNETVMKRITDVARSLPAAEPRRTSIWNRLGTAVTGAAYAAGTKAITNLSNSFLDMLV